MSLAGILAFSLNRLFHGFSSGVKIYIADIGQGDGILVEFPDQKTWLIDAGDRWGKGSAFSQVLLPELAAQGKRSIEKVVLSHPDQDHAYGLLDALEKWEILNLTSHAYFLKAPPFLLQQILHSADQKKVKIEWLEKPVEYFKRDALVRIVPVSIGDKTNNQVLVLEIDYQGCRALFMGDAEKEAEEKFIKNYSGSIDLLKVAHHGSKTSSHEGFLNKTQPQYAAISVGQNNMYSHPHPSAIQRLRNLSSTILRTDRHGYILFTFTARGTLHCQSASGFCGELVCRGNASQ